MLRLQLVSPTTGTIDMLLALRSGGGTADMPRGSKLLQAVEVDSSDGEGGREEEQEDAAVGGSGGGGGEARGGALSPELHERLDSR